MADAVGKKSLLCVPQESHKRIRHLLSDPFSVNSLSKFVQRFDNMLCERLKKVQKEGKSFTVLDFNMKITFDAMCDMLMSIKDASLLEQIERDCTVVSDAMLSFPIMIPRTRNYKGIKAGEMGRESNSWEIFKKLHQKRMAVLLMPSRRALI